MSITASTPKRLMDISGQVFGRIIVTSFSHWHVFPSGNRAGMWLCKCECGNEKTVQGGDLKSGRIKSCGCFLRESVKARMTIHGHTTNTSKSPLYQVWSCMTQRITNPEDSRYNDYGGRGITIDPRWLKFENFAKDMGDRPSLAHSIDRKDNSLGYFKDNCCWSTQKVQSRNKRNNHILEYQGISMCIAEWAEQVGLKYNTLSARLHKNWTIERALTTPVK